MFFGFGADEKGSLVVASGRYICREPKGTVEILVFAAHGAGWLLNSGRGVRLEGRGLRERATK